MGNFARPKLGRFRGPLTAESRHNRFCGGIHDDTIRSYAATARGRDVILHGFLVDGVLRGAADLRIVRPLDQREAEAAFSIEKPWQRHGVGSALLERTLLTARNRGIKHLQVCCLVENLRMQQLARKFAADITFDFGTVIGTMENPRPTPLSVTEATISGQFVQIFGRKGNPRGGDVVVKVRQR